MWSAKINGSTAKYAGLSEVNPVVTPKSFLIRDADDFVMGFAQEEDARRVLAVLPERFAK